MQCKTERCLIRELVPDDWKSMQKIAVDFRKSKYAVYDMPLPVEDAEIIARTKQFAQTQMFYAVLLHDVMIGYICFHEDHGMYDLGYCFHSDYQGKGYAFESCCAMMNYIFHERSINIFTAGTALKNKPSCKLLEKAWIYPSKRKLRLGYACKEQRFRGCLRWGTVRWPGHFAAGDDEVYVSV